MPTAPDTPPTEPVAPVARLRLQLPGLTQVVPAWSGADVSTSGPCRRVELGGSRRDGQAASSTLELAADEVVKVELDDGLVLWTRADDLLREQGRQQVGRGQGGLPVWTLSPQLSPARGGVAATQRGLAGMAIKALEFAGVDVSALAARQLGELIERKRLGREPGLYQLSLDDGPPRFTRVPDGTRLAAGEQPVLVFLHGTMSSLLGSFGALWAQGDQGGTEAERQAAQAARAALRDTYGERVYALEHFTLSQSPVANALALARQLPAQARLHLVSHSRGGLVGELLALAQRQKQGSDPVREALAAGVFKRGQAEEPLPGLGLLAGSFAQQLRDDYAADQADLDRLLTELDEGGLKVERFVRVACPARGTTLASGRLDRWLSVIGALAPSGWLGDSIDFLLKVVKERTDPRTLPGLEAMMPQSPLTQLLRWPTLRTAADLTAITGDLEPDKRWARLKLLALDWFYDADHDLVVNTGSMAGGVQRLPERARFRQARGPLVNHFRYFTNPDSLEWMVQGLRRPEGSQAGFLPIEQAQQANPRARAAVRASRSGGGAGEARKPVAILVPGTMGSGLKVNDSGVWLRYGALALGGLGKINIEASGVEPDGLVDDFYAPLLEYLAPSHQLHVVPYDWRLSVRVAAQRLLETLETALVDAEARQVPVRIVAHSMGGLVTRAMIATPAGALAWKRLMALPGSRLLMLGTPNAGSHEAVRWLTGFNPTQGKLTLLDLTRGTNGIIDIVRRFPGLAELLPFAHMAGDRQFADPALWRQLRDELKAGFPPAGDDALAPARQTWQLLASQPELPPSHVVYVAGQQPATVVDYQVVDDPFATGPQPPRLEFIATPDGDGTVAWASGQLPGIAMFRAPDIAHDALCAAVDDPRIFRGYRDLLETGQTSQLPRLELPARRRGGAGAGPADDSSRRFVLVEPPAADCALDETSLRGLGFGPAPRGGPAKAAAAAALPPLQISVCNGNLQFVDRPLLLGHYESSRLTGTEAVVDKLIGRAMSQALACGLYPEAPGTHQIFENRSDATLTARQMPRPAQVIVAGLGSEGQLRLPSLIHTVRQAVIALAQRRHDAGQTEPLELALTLLGSGGQGISAGTAAQAIAMGVREANQRLQDANAQARVRAGSGGGSGGGSGSAVASTWPLVRHIHLVELYLDRAVEAWQGLSPLAEGEPGCYALTPRVQALLGARRRPADAGYRGANYDSITVRTVDELVPVPKADELDADDLDSEDAGSPAAGGAAAQRPLRRRSITYALDTRRARTEVSAQRTQARLLRSLIREASNHDASDPRIGRTLWQLLIPPEIEAFLGGDSEQTSSRATDLVMQLDDGTAGIPWELLDSRSKDNPDRPPWALRTRLLRRLDVATRGEPVRDARGDDPLLVIGEPLVNPDKYPPLPGAFHEAKAVRRLLEAALGANTGAVHALIGPEVGRGPEARDVMAALFERDWRVIHVAGHGEYGAEGGVVLSKGLVLGPNEVAAMRRVPELVFLNCCHLAAEDPARTLRVADYDRPRFAAGLARALIEKGVRCVIAAGWAVDDAPAERFATTFYEKLLGGQRFIDAVHAAREAAWEADRRSNTWAAYQCYGDPDWAWRASVRNAPREMPSDEELAESEGLSRVVSPLTLTLRLENLLLDAREGSGGRSPELMQALLDLMARRFGPEWGGMGAVAEAFGLAFAEAGQRGEAIRWLQRAVDAPDGSASVKAVEQLGNHLARSASPAQPEAGRQRVAEAVSLLTRLGALKQTMERQCLLGSAWKRLALIEQQAGDLAAERQALQRSADAYAAGELLAIEEGAPNRHYPANNALAMRLRLALLDGQLPPPPDEDALASIRQAMSLQNLSQPDFWSVVGETELQINLALCQQQLAPRWPGIRAALDDLHTRQPSPNQWGSVRDQARLLLLPYRQLPGLSEAEDAAAEALLALLQQFSQ